MKTIETYEVSIMFRCHNEDKALQVIGEISLKYKIKCKRDLTYEGLSYVITYRTDDLIKALNAEQTIVTVLAWNNDVEDFQVDYDGI